MTDDLPGRLRSTTEQMANRCSVDAHLWNVHSNTALEAADEIEKLRGICRTLVDSYMGEMGVYHLGELARAWMNARKALGYDR